eukprot:183150-Prorocentrum_minimum.AAC.1
MHTHALLGAGAAPKKGKKKRLRISHSNICTCEGGRIERVTLLSERKVIGNNLKVIGNNITQNLHMQTRQNRAGHSSKRAHNWKQCQSDWKPSQSDWKPSQSDRNNLTSISLEVITSMAFMNTSAAMAMPRKVYINANKYSAPRASCDHMFWPGISTKLSHCAYDAFAHEPSNTDTRCPPWNQPHA